MSLPVVILAGGLGTRLGEIAKSIPKALVEVNGEPFLAHQLRLLRSNGVGHVVMCVGHLGEMIRDYAGDGRAFGLHLEYSFDGPVLLGTAGAIRRALPFLGGAFFVLYGDSYLPCDFGAVERAFEEAGKAALMTVYRNEGQWDSSNVEFADGQLIAYDKIAKSPRMHHIDYGLGVFRRSVFQEPRDPGPLDLAWLYQNLLVRGELAAFEISQRFYEIGSVSGLQELSEYLASRNTKPL
ncbi:MAG: nucleotidyltransferase family protein [Bryobacteraceae bacterium]